ncbi:hypothetical protein CIRMBP1310_01684 [Enterococcus cecorum]|uniref:hypothetical protein n=1 Tax=Enterococcus cecorum TaxID=44008 RepID=UPI000A88BC90|nr:hypothetical protein [Enterococcus cecorum]MCJ0522261.1 hypothetical protein [Enterococcus cecorum]MCJ0535944.1 hypothetical protein [Enterococcus cecorum]MCJ0543131.1 hypothetical protein [Enterococcus cecorum]MCJ0547586.1 hypothetical protein [Enterococcus cecorum]MCJ0554955.1 hypothetical protein [Enterococcus cecorum]
MNEDSLKYLIAKLIEDADDVKAEFENIQNKDEKLFLEGKRLAYYEMLLTIQNELDIEDQDLAEFGLNINLEKEYA